MTNQPPSLTDRQVPLEIVVGRLLWQHPLTVATAESCTGGLIGHRLTEVAGSSAYFLGGIIAYSNEVKEHLLGVKSETLATHGAVSAETALEMARGARRRLGADIAVSVTGIAGPDGGTADKPIGLTYVALVAANDERVARFVWGHDRAGNKWESSEAALRMIRNYVTTRAGS